MNRKDLSDDIGIDLMDNLVVIYQKGYVGTVPLDKKEQEALLKILKDRIG